MNHSDKRRENLATKDSFYEVLLNAAAERKQSSKAMPEDVKEMLGLKTQEQKQPKIEKTKPKHPLQQKSTFKSTTPKKLKGKETTRQHSVKEKFEHENKRKVIDDYLNTPKKRLPTCPIPFRQKSAKEQKISVLNMLSDSASVTPKESVSPTPQRLDLSDVIIAAAAAKMVKLNPEGSLLKHTSIYQKLYLKFLRRLLKKLVNIAARKFLTSARGGNGTLLARH